MSEQKKVKTIVLKRPEEIFTSPVDCSAVEDVKKQIRENEHRHLDYGQLREQEDWSALANLVVGAEGD